MAAEIGADALKIPYPQDRETFKRITTTANIPVLILGGEKMEKETDALNLASEAMAAGASGVVFGRNVIQSDAPEAIARKIYKIIHPLK